MHLGTKTEAGDVLSAQHGNTTRTAWSTAVRQKICARDEPCSEAGEGTAMPELLFTVLGDAGSQSPTRGPQCHCYCAKHDRNGGVLS